MKVYCSSPKADIITRPWHLSSAQNTNHSLFYTLSTVNTLHSFHPKPTWLAGLLSGRRCFWSFSKQIRQLLWLNDRRYFLKIPWQEDYQTEMRKHGVCVPLFSFNQTDPRHLVGYAVFQRDYLFYMSLLSSMRQDNCFLSSLFIQENFRGADLKDSKWILEGRVVVNESNHLL